MEHDEEMVLVTTASVKINYVHDSVRLLKKVERALVLLPLNELVGRVVQLRHDDGDLVFGHAQLFVVMSIEGVVIVIKRRLGGLRLLTLVPIGSHGAFTRLFTAGVAGTRWVLILRLVLTTTIKARVSLVLLGKDSRSLTRQLLGLLRLAPYFS